MYFEKINIRDIPDSRYAEEAARDKERISSYKEDDLKRTLAGRILLRDMISRYYKRDSFEITYNKNGKPETDFCCFSIAHSGDFAVCAVSEYPVGADIEKSSEIKKRSSYMLFDRDENRYVNEALDFITAYLTLWTMKEAFVKAKGATLKEAANSHLVTPELKLIKETAEFCYKTERFGDYFTAVCEKNKII